MSRGKVECHDNGKVEEGQSTFCGHMRRGKVECYDNGKVEGEEGKEVTKREEATNANQS